MTKRSPITSDVSPTTLEPNPAREAWKAQIPTEEPARKAAELETEKERAKHIFHIFDGKKLPKYEDFNPYDPEEQALGYGGSAKKLGFKVALVAQWIKNNEKFKTDVDTGILYFYDGKTWIANAEPYLEYLVNIILEKDTKVSHYNNIEFSLKSLTYERMGFSQKIACENGLLDVETQTLTPFDEKEMPFHAIPVKYDPAIGCPNWEAFVNDVISPDDVAMIQEWSGYLLLPDYRFHKFLWLFGEGRNGKGVWQRTMEAILGEKNISSVGLEEFDGNHRFALVQLYGKLFNPCSEPPTVKALQTALLKKVTGQDNIEAEMKGKQKRLSFKNTAKITVLGNKFPRVHDTSTAFRERLLLIKFTKVFVGTDQIQNIEKNWLKTNDERSGILNWMLEGLKRLLTQGYFTDSKTQQETEAEFLRASDTIGAFLKEMAIFDKNRVTTRSEAFEHYKNYCEVVGLEAENEKKFTVRLKETPRIGVTKVNKPKQERAWKGLGLKQIDDEGKIIQSSTDSTFSTLPIYSDNFEETNQNIKEYKTPVPTVPSVPNPSVPTQEDNIIYYQQVNPYIESHKCDNCKALLATFKQLLDKETTKEKGKEAIYCCTDCFNHAKNNAERHGVKFVPLPMDEPHGESL